ncbi:hypothetical protein K458DRAFT_206465 [Lentithecium fluviatile CBS 122367]|uniref:Uncharacterized protein n=1 Tax=Lentithecium fluviatile CBS 122367 TaxID=1168545 RepID=A0A6G1IBT2_9PLEO|nr:hypothetical protein K458DRAFT_206465 [Lentithecium fluviatile CBS 122367]
MAASTPQSGQAAASNEQAEPSTNSQSQPTEPQHTNQPEWRQPTADIGHNPYGATEFPRRYRKHQTVWVTRRGHGSSETVEATVTDYEKDRTGRWNYWLKDKKGHSVWRDQPIWFSESQLSTS